jgi:hypothetical protein
MSGMKAASVFARNALSHRGLIIRGMAPELLNELNAVAARVELVRVGCAFFMIYCSFALRICKLGKTQLSRIFQTCSIVILSRTIQETRKVWERSKYLVLDGDGSRSHLEIGREKHQQWIWSDG